MSQHTHASGCTVLRLADDVEPVAAFACRSVLTVRYDGHQFLGQ